MKHVHRPVGEGILFAVLKSPIRHVRNALPFALGARLDVYPKAVDTGQLSLVFPFPKDCARYAALAPEVVFQPWLRHVAGRPTIRLPIRGRRPPCPPPRPQLLLDA